MLRFIVLALLYFWAVVNVDESMMSIGLYIAIPSAFILSFWCTTGKLCDDKCFKIFIIFLLLALVSMFAPAESNLYEMIDKTYAVKYLYNYNILLQLFMKI